MHIQLSSDNLEHMTTHQFAEVISSIVLVLERLPNIPLADLKNLDNRFVDYYNKSEDNLVYKGVPVHLSQDQCPDDWRASIEWYGHLMDVDLQEMEKPTRDNIILATHRLINVLTDIKNYGVVHPDSYFIDR